MATNRGSRGDATRSMELLWGLAPVPTRGPKQGLTVERIVAAAVELADAQGLDALSMRRVAEALGVGAMSLYTYVPGKAELIDLMLDHVYGQQVAAISTDEGWRAGLESRARADWAMYTRHPWVVRAIGPRPTLGPNESDLGEITLGTVDGLGLTGREMVAILTLVTGYVAGVARGIAEAVAEGETHTSEEDWWQERSAVLERVYTVERFPLSCRLEAEGTFAGDPDESDYLAGEIRATFEFGLQRVLDGIAVLVDQRASTAAPRPQRRDPKAVTPRP